MAPGAKMTREELLPCPFCGQRPRVVEDTSYGDCQIFCVCALEPCAAAPVGEMNLCITKWNMRMPPTPDEQEKGK